MTLSQAFGILAASIAFVAILVAIGAAVAAHRHKQHNKGEMNI